MGLFTEPSYLKEALVCDGRWFTLIFDLFSSRCSSVDAVESEPSPGVFSRQVKFAELSSPWNSTGSTSVSLSYSRRGGKRRACLLESLVFGFYFNLLFRSLHHDQSWLSDSCAPASSIAAEQPGPLKLKAEICLWVVTGSCYETLKTAQHNMFRDYWRQIQEQMK